MPQLHTRHYCQYPHIFDKGSVAHEPLAGGLSKTGRVAAITHLSEAR
ncbi:MAG: hypothetical protein WAK48_09380 [Candidatus Acidiferrum sp.]